MKHSSEALVLAVLVGLAFCVTALAAGEVTTLDDGNLYLFVSDNGTFAFDSSASRGEYSGLYYPRDTRRWVMSGGGIWVAGKKNGQWRVTVSGAESEFVPGPVQERAHTPSPFPIYKITRGENYAFNDDYRNWPTTLGAPTNAEGHPITMGSQCLFTLFNDNDTSAHTFDIAGSLPLGVEVSLYAYTYDNTYQTFDTMMTQVVFFAYTITNRSKEQIDSCIVTTYGDPDIGYPGDDRIGSDIETGTAFCYDENSHDQYYGNMTPAVGICFLSEKASSANFYYAYRRTDSPSVKLDSLYKTINLIKGLRLTGEQYIDSTTMQPTRFPFSGNLADSAGWTNKLSKDYRFVISTSPVSLPAGGSVSITAALIVARGQTNKESVRKLLETAHSVRESYRTNAAPLQVLVSEPNMVSIKGASIHGSDWGGRYLSGGLDLAPRFFGDSASPESLPVVKLTINNSPVQRGYRYVPDGDSFRYVDYASEPVDVLNAASGERLDFAYIDLDKDGSLDNEEGALDPIIIFTTPHSDTLRSYYTHLNLRSPAPQRLLAVQLDKSLAELIGEGLVVNTNSMQQPFAAISSAAFDTLIFAEPVGSGYSERTLKFSNDSRFVQEIELVSSDPQHLRAIPSNVQLGTGESTFVFLHIYPSDAYDFSGTLQVVSRRLRSDSTVLPFAVDLTAGVPGDANEDGVLSLHDIIFMIKILYRDAPMLTPQRLLDLNCDNAFDLADLVILLNVLYQQINIPCWIEY